MKSLKVLVVDDCNEDFELYKEYAHRGAIDIHFANNTRQTIDMVNHACDEGHCYDVIVTDINFNNNIHGASPTYTGVTSAREVRRTHEDTPIIFVTGYDSFYIRDEVSKLGNTWFFSKPFDFQEVFDKIRELGNIHLETCKSAPQERGRERLKVPEVLEKIMTKVRLEKKKYIF